MAKKKVKKLPPNSPDPDCTNCFGRGAYPPEEVGGMYITVRIGKTKNPVPCKHCKH